MSASATDTKVSSIAFGFALGFGYLTAWDAYKITSRNRNPLRSLFVWMVWAELAANLAIAILAWLFLEGVLPATLPTFFFIFYPSNHHQPRGHHLHGYAFDSLDQMGHHHLHFSDQHLRLLHLASSPSGCWRHICQGQQCVGQDHEGPDRLERCCPELVLHRAGQEAAGSERPAEVQCACPLQHSDYFDLRGHGYRAVHDQSNHSHLQGIHQRAHGNDLDQPRPQSLHLQPARHRHRQGRAPRDVPRAQPHLNRVRAKAHQQRPGPGEHEPHLHEARSHRASLGLARNDPRGLAIGACEQPGQQGPRRLPWPPAPPGRRGAPLVAGAQVTTKAVAEKQLHQMPLTIWIYTSFSALFVCSNRGVLFFYLLISTNTPFAQSGMQMIKWSCCKQRPCF
ncbi:hypothetical protein MPH_12447 [Macrophomina phaseolina MS6]|uniref:Uncharacterized protein n=1 Tax=Macrophomina phaseolina (strain MS6) TaxID=1126212 RepID=K2RKF3_MACPH|nr:hypothetical protein MPH_12447 [Macrophomina phaseolina MS6]